LITLKSPPAVALSEIFLSGVPHRGSNLGMTLRERFAEARVRLHPRLPPLAARLFNNDCPPEWVQVLWAAPALPPDLRRSTCPSAGGGTTQ
jgi:hypothetical protein